MRVDRKRQLAEMSLQELRQVLIKDIRKIPTGGGSGSDVSDQIGKIVKLEAFVKEDMARLQDELILVRFLIDSLDNMLERQILDIRYVRGWRNWYRIAEEVHYSAIHVKRTHGIALKKLVPLVEEILLKKER